MAGHGVDRQEPLRAQERQARAHRGQHLRAQLGRGAGRLRDPLHGAQFGQPRELVNRGGRDVPAQRGPARGRRHQHPRPRHRAGQPAGARHPDPEQPLPRHRSPALGRERYVPPGGGGACVDCRRAQHDRAVRQPDHRLRRDADRAPADPRVPVHGQRRAAQRLRHLRQRARDRPAGDRVVLPRQHDREQRAGRRARGSLPGGQQLPVCRGAHGGVCGPGSGGLPAGGRERAAVGAGRRRLRGPGRRASGGRSGLVSPLSACRPGRCP